MHFSLRVVQKGFLGLVGGSRWTTGSHTEIQRGHCSFQSKWGHVVFLS